MAEGNRKSGRRARPRKKPGDKGARSQATSALAAFWAKRKSAIVGAALGITAAAVVSLAILVLFFGRTRGPNRPVPVLDVEWPAGLDADAAADRLAALGLVSDAHAMSVFLKATGGTRDFVPGPHLLPTGASPWELKRLLARSLFRPSAKVVVPEGYNRFDIAARLEKLRVASKRAFLAASSDPALLRELHLDGATDPALGPESAEGFLFPATYDFALDTDPREVVRTLVAAFEKRWAALASQHDDGLVSLDASLGFKRREIVILASIIEKEAAVDDERPMIASVFLNRLLDPAFKPKRLQSDPTSAYGCFALGGDEVPSCKGWSGKPTPAINKDPKNRYSTYVHNGLPPGPISNPGARSIEAVMAPAGTKYLYFVAAGNGRHAFSETLDAHNDAVTRGAIAVSGARPIVALALAPAIAAAGSLLAPSLHVAAGVAAGVAFAGALATAVVPLALACRAKIDGRAAFALAAAGVALVAIAAISRPAAPIAVVVVDAGLVLAASAIGGAIGSRIVHPGHLLPACVVAAAADVASLAEGPTRAIAESERALSLLALGFAVPGTRFVAPAIGFGDALFLALVLGCAATHGLGVARVAILGAVGLAAAGLLSARFDVPIPALVTLALAIVIGVPRARALRKEDRKTSAVAAILAGTIAAALLTRRLLLG